MSEPFRFLDLPVELQLNVLEQSIPYFSVRSHVGYHYCQGSDYISAFLDHTPAGEEAVKKLLWIPRHLRSRLKEALTNRFDGTFIGDPYNLGLCLSSSRGSSMPWHAIRTLDFASGTPLCFFDTCLFHVAQMLEKQWLTNLKTIKYKLEARGADIYLEFLKHDISASALADGSLHEEVLNYCLPLVRLEEDRLEWPEDKDVEVDFKVILGKEKRYVADLTLSKNRKLAVAGLHDLHIMPRP